MNETVSLFSGIHNLVAMINIKINNENKLLFMKYEP